ncbi:MAG: hypothetical protein K8S54_08385 [Spirochaetia bacterium]|nr:hypothetical protein [Spirochaetia bacterium]
MKHAISILFATFLLLSFNCRTLPPVEPSGAAPTAALLVVAGPPELMGVRQGADLIYLVKSQTGQDLVGKPIVKTTYNVKERVYSLNCEPGTYTIIGFHMTVKSQAGTYMHNYFFDEPSARKMTFKVEAGKLNIAGDFKPSFDVSISTKPDSLQSFAANAIAPGTLGAEGVGKAILTGLLAGGGEVSHLTRVVSSDTSEGTMNTLKKSAAEDFAETKWSVLTGN